jgi:hypothetical protein
MINLIRTLAAVAVITTATVSPVEAKISFLEAALFFLTDVEATHEDTATDREIILRQYPLVAYLVDGNPCLVRLRSTSSNRPNSIWQMDFCKITRWQWVRGGWPGRDSLGQPAFTQAGYHWFGKDAFCISRNWHEDENYMDPDFAKIVGHCNVMTITSHQEEIIAYDDKIDIGTLINKGGPSIGGRPVNRMIRSYRYLTWLLKGEEPKPY